MHGVHRNFTKKNTTDDITQAQAGLQYSRAFVKYSTVAGLYEQVIIFRFHKKKWEFLDWRAKYKLFI